MPSKTQGILAHSTLSKLVSLRHLGIVAGEASGDLLGASLIHALRTHAPHLQSVGVAGGAMQAAGCHSLFNIERLSVMGFFAPLLRLPELIKRRADLYQYFRHARPELFIGVDAPDFNLGLEIKLRQCGIPVVHYVSPSVWAWRQYRVRKIKRAVDLMLTLFPFEATFYEQYHIPVCYVGHPLADQIPLNIDIAAARCALGLDQQATYIALLPGSRRQDMRYLAKTFLLAAQHVWEQRPHLRFVTSQVNELRYQEFYAAHQQYTPFLPLQFFIGRSQEVLAAADLVLVKSGTATLEAMLFKKPMVIAYRLSAVGYQIAKRLVKMAYIGLPNLLAQEALVPELIQQAAHPQAIAQCLFDYLDYPDKVLALQDRFTTLHQQLRMNSAQRAAQAIAAML